MDAPSISGTLTSAGTTTVVIAQTNGGGNRLLDLYMNDVEQGGGVQTGTTSPVVFQNAQIGRFNVPPAGDLFYYNRDIAEILLYNRALATNERQDIEAYVYQKYGVTTQPLATSPAIGLPTGIYSGTQSVVLSATGSPGATIYYTTDGSP